MVRALFFIVLTSVFLFGGSVTMRYNAKYGVNNFHTIGAQNFTKKVEQYTNGSVKITVYPSDALIKGDSLVALKEGKAEMSDMFLPFTSSGGKAFGLSALPFVASNYNDAYKLYKISKKVYEKIFNQWNQKLLYAVAWPPTGFYANQVITTLDDIEGLHTRTYDKNSEKFVKSAGGNAVAMAWKDVVPSLKNKKLNSVVTSSASGKDGKFWEVLSDFTKIKYAYPIQAASISLDAWNSLTQAQQNAIKKAAYEIEKEQWEKSKKEDEIALKMLKQNGMNIHDINAPLQKELNRVAHGMVNAFLKDKSIDVYNLFGPEMLEYFMVRFISL